MQELLRIARIYHADLNGVSLDFQIGDRCLSFEGVGGDIVAYRSEGIVPALPETATTANLPGLFRWLAGVE